MPLLHLAGWFCSLRGLAQGKTTDVFASQELAQQFSGHCKLISREEVLPLSSAKQPGILVTAYIVLGIFGVSLTHESYGGNLCQTLTFSFANS